jgi:AraC-like DNA-binding protein/mannose-6-phosphate isomerase-like protein (cupin superfamily)
MEDMMDKSYEIIDANGRFLLNMENHNLETSYSGSAHCHHQLEISYIKEGRGKYHIDDKIYDVEQGDVFLFNNIERHKLVVDSADRLINLVIHFEPRFIWSQTDNSFDLRYLQIFYSRSINFTNRLDRNNPATAKISELFSEIEEEFENKQHGYELMVKVRLLNIFVLISRCFFPAPKDLCNTHMRHGIADINKILDYIDTNIGQELSLDDLANMAHMNPTYFSTFFKKYNGIKPSEYIRSKRIEKSIEYLKFSEKNITEIANLCGFNNMTSFYNAFKKVTSFTPSDYR